MGLSVNHIPEEEEHTSEESLRLMNLELERRVEEKTREVIAYERRFRALIENGMEAITLLNEKFLPIYRSPSSSRLTGWTMEDRLKYGIVEQTHPEDMAKVNELLEKVVANPGKPYRLTFRTKHKDGHYVALDGSVINLLHDESVRAIVTNMYDVTESKEAEDLLKESHAELRLLASHLQDVREQERTAMAREIHDELGQQLTGLKMDISWLNKRKDLNDQAARAKIREILALVDATVSTVRRLAAELRPAILDDLGLPEALEWHGKQFQQRSGIRTALNIQCAKAAMQGEIATGLFRICQEALTNVARHSGATEVTVALDTDDQIAKLTVCDNGKGFDVRAIEQKSTLGILGMKERSLMMGGKFEYISQPGRGTSIQVTVPMNVNLLETK